MNGHIPAADGGRHRPGARRAARRVAAVLSFLLLPGLLAPVAFAADTDPLGKPRLKAARPDKVSPFTAKTNKKTAAAVEEGAAAVRRDAARAKTEQAARSVTWPRAGSAMLTPSATGTALAAPGTLPVELKDFESADKKLADKNKALTPGDGVKVSVLDQSAAVRLGVKGVVLTVKGPSGGGSADLGIDYSAFASAYGGDWAGRLQILRLPACALTNDASAKCRSRTPLKSANHRKDQTIESRLVFTGASDKLRSSSASAGTMVLALAAGTKSGGGDYKATPLESSSAWAAGGSSGTFTWSYPLRVPPSAAGPKPDLAISYDSGSVDGRTASTNNQGTVIGEGFDITSSFIERKYGSCDDDGQTDKSDLCWKYDNASLVLNGQATELVKDDTTGKWRLKNDDASTVTRSTGADNGDDNGEHWTVVTGNGTKYVFGLDKLEGAPAGNRTESVWTVPVFGDDEGEPGYADGTSFAGRSKKQAWRWNLDYVEDTHANAMTYWYAAETNNYDQLGDDDTGTPYIRGGYLKEIRYGQRAGALFTGSPQASDKVVFSYAERCIAAGTGCDALGKDTRANWPDVPFDAVCQDSKKCTGNVGPSFFTRKRMTAIATYAWDAAAATPGFAKVDTWALKQKYLDPGDTGDTTDQSLWLNEIRHTGNRGTALSLDPVTFQHEFLANRVDGETDDILPLYKPRLYTITSEAGSQTVVTYLPSDCAAAGTKPRADENTKRCYPVRWAPNGGQEPTLDWFQKYPVQTVSNSDPHGGSEAVLHTYQYSGGGAWHYNEDPFTPEEERTWSIWRGFQRVTHFVGSGRDGRARSRTVTVFMRGMHGDRVLGPDGRTLDPDKRRTATVTGIKAPAIDDHGQYAGFTRETVTYDNTVEVAGTVNDPWSRRTATQHKSYADIEAYYVRSGASHARTNVTSGTTPYDRVRTTTTSYDDYGMAEAVEDRGDNAVPGDEKCTRTWYARNDAAGINSLVSRTRTVAKACGVKDAALDLPADSRRPGDVISDTATSYDSTTWTAAQKPVKGEARWTGRAQSYDAADAPVWQKMTTTDYDALGRAELVKDMNDKLTAQTTYVPTLTGPVTATTVKNAKLHATTTALDIGTGFGTKVTDPNGRVTESEYDALGRVVKVWLPNRSKSLGKSPNFVYTYRLINTDVSWVASATLNGDASGYNTTYEFFDSLLRTRQVQAVSPAGGRIVAQTLYDDRGLAVSTQADIWDNRSDPSGTMVQVDGGQAPKQTDNTFDGAGRVVREVTKNYNVVRSTNTTSYTGDVVAKSAPQGGRATAEVTNALGQTVERREYAGPQPTGTAYTKTGITYTPTGKQDVITAPDKSTWDSGYDLFGRETSTVDPDKGEVVTEYNALDQAVSITDARNKVLLSGYDELGRKTGLWDGVKSDATKLAAWTFDSLAKGQPDTTVRYTGGSGTAGRAYTQKITAYDPLYQATGNQLILPDRTKEPLVAAGVPQILSFSTVYNLDGSIKQAQSPAAGGLPAETVSYGYNFRGKGLHTTAKGTTGYVQGAAYSPLGDLNQLSLATDAASTRKVYLNYQYESGTRRLTNSFATSDVHSYRLQDLAFSQDDAGNVTSIFDNSTMGGASQADYQCFAYDGQRRLTEAWTPKSAGCGSAGRTTANLGGAAPYWTSYTYNEAGQRKTSTQHAAAGDTVTDYSYGTPTGQPHPLSSTTTGGKVSGYAHDLAGNTTTRPGKQAAAQSLIWDSEGKLASVTEPAAGGKAAIGTDYLYDAAGELLIRRNSTADGDTVLYLGTNEIRLTKKGTGTTLKGTRYYSAAQQTIAVRTATAGVSGTTLTFLAADHHGTSSIAVDAVTMTVVRRFSTPFGAPRGSAPAAWPDDKAFLGKPADVLTGLTHIGAREYDPVIGQFLSVDPLLEIDKAQSLNGYSYAENTPVTLSDPSGQGSISCQRGSCPAGMEEADSNVSSGWGGGGGGGGGGGSGGGGTAVTSSAGSTSNGLGGWVPGATFNYITGAWDIPYANFGNLEDFLARQGPDYGIIDEGGSRNEWETSRALFFGWLWGGGFPLAPKQEFRGGDAFTAILASDSTFTDMRAKLVGQAVNDGAGAEGALAPLDFKYQDKGPEPGSPWYKLNTPRGVANDVMGTLSNGSFGTKNQADAFLGSYTATGQITAVDRKKGTVRLKFTATNLSDWNSATHLIPRDRNPVFRDTYGAAVRENFTWEERWPLNSCMCWVE
ncbi:RHS repeat-associated core domain-containing protein [Streptomyces microflavus]|uniref:RHS repeat-associated core domain-containing protein n=1 Tax=Streptomyces microflavus TaxID=1919 RepID=UPI003318083E